MAVRLAELMLGVPGPDGLNEKRHVTLRRVSLLYVFVPHPTAFFSWVSLDGKLDRIDGVMVSDF